MGILAKELAVSHQLPKQAPYILSYTKFQSLLFHFYSMDIVEILNFG